MSDSIQEELGAAYGMPVRMYGTVDDSIVDGPGLRFSVFVQGCSHRCPGCHNAESQPACGGYADTVGHVCELIAASSSVTGVTLSGGEPFEQPEACLAIARWCKARGLNVWAYSGYLYEDIAAGRVPRDAAVRGDVGSAMAEEGELAGERGEATAAEADKPFDPVVSQEAASRPGSAMQAVRSAAQELLEVCDVLVDGPFIQAQRSYDLRWKGSQNQRVVDLRKTKRAGRVMLWGTEEFDFPIPESW